MKASYRKHATKSTRYTAYYQGVILSEDGKVIWRCGHIHRHPIKGGIISLSATDCATDEINRRSAEEWTAK